MCLPLSLPNHAGLYSLKPPAEINPLSLSGFHQEFCYNNEKAGGLGGSLMTRPPLQPEEMEPRMTNAWKCQVLKLDAFSLRIFQLEGQTNPSAL